MNNMPFSYYGAKHSLASSYGPPVGNRIVEPFAGSAAYSCHYAHLVERVDLWEKDEKLVELWRRLLQMTPEDLEEVESHLNNARTDETLIGLGASGESAFAALNRKMRKITPRMRERWPQQKRRILRWFEHRHKFNIHHGDYTESITDGATVFVDPPYKPIDDRPHTGGNLYTFSARGFDYERLAEWCQSIPAALVIVTEQSPADWLPFWNHQCQTNTDGVKRVEVVWRSDRQQLGLPI